MQGQVPNLLQAYSISSGFLQARDSRCINKPHGIRFLLHSARFTNPITFSINAGKHLLAFKAAAFNCFTGWGGLW